MTFLKTAKPIFSSPQYSATLFAPDLCAIFTELRLETRTSSGIQYTNSNRETEPFK